MDLKVTEHALLRSCLKLQWRLLSDCGWGEWESAGTRHTALESGEIGWSTPRAQGRHWCANIAKSTAVILRTHGEVCWGESHHGGNKEYRKP